MLNDKSVACSRNTVTNVLDRAKELGLEWPLAPDLSAPELGKMFYPSKLSGVSDRKMPNTEYVRKELLKNGVSKKLLWMEYLEECRLSGEKPLMYSQYCWYLQEAEMKRRASMHIPRKPGEQVEVDWAGDSAQIIDPDTGEITNAYVFVGVLSFSQYTYAEAFPNKKQTAWINAHVHMFQFFGGVPRILVYACHHEYAKRQRSEDGILHSIPLTGCGIKKKKALIYKAFLSLGGEI